MQLAMVNPAERDRELVADAPAESARLGEPQMMGITRALATDDARVCRHKLPMPLVAQAALLRQQAAVLVGRHISSCVRGLRAAAQLGQWRGLIVGVFRSLVCTVAISCRPRHLRGSTSCALDNGAGRR
jgi:hypothetical protein